MSPGNIYSLILSLALLTYFIARAKPLRYQYRKKLKKQCKDGDYAGAEKTMDLLLSKFPPTLFEYGYQALIMHQLHEYERAVELYTKCIHMAPGTPSFFYNRAYAYLSLHDYDMAERDFSATIRMQQANVSAYNNRGYTHLMMGNLESGKADIDHALTLDGDNSYVYRNLGIYYYEKQDWVKAKEYFGKAYSLDPSTQGLTTYLVALAEKEGLR
jgi:tetratricopeptide (TPR) repeat protein